MVSKSFLYHELKVYNSFTTFRVLKVSKWDFSARLCTYSPNYTCLSMRVSYLDILLFECFIKLNNMSYVVYFILGYCIHEVHFNNILTYLSEKWGTNNRPPPLGQSSLNHIAVMFGDFRGASIVNRDGVQTECRQIKYRTDKMSTDKMSKGKMLTFN